MIETSLGAVAYINPSSVGNNYSYKEIDYIDISSVGSGVLMGTTHYHISNAPSRAKRLVSHGDTILSTVRPNRRSFLFIKNPRPDMVVSTGFAVLRASDKIEPRFLYYLVTNQPFTDYLTANAKGAAYPAVDTEIIGRAKINLPPLHIQHKIASILSAYDDLIENNNRRIKILEEMAQAIYKEWFVNFRFPGHEKVKMVKSELGMIPEGWEVRKLATLVETQYGYTETASDEELGPKFLRGTDINKNSFIDWSNVPYCQIPESKLQNYSLSVGDIVIIRMADPGKVGIIEKEINAIFASYLVRLKIKSAQLSPYFLFYFLLSERYQGYITGASTGTTRKSASAGVITDVDVAVPSADLREIFEEKIIVIRKMLNNLLDRNTNLRKTRNLLLPKLISGKIDVSGLKINDSKTG